MYASSSRARIMQMRIKLMTIEKNDLSVTDYFKKVKKLADTLAAISKRLDSEEFISYLLRILPSDYNVVVTSIATRANTFTISDVYAHLPNFLTRLEHKNAYGQTSSVDNANRVSGQGS
jgi:hypothetical protein